MRPEAYLGLGEPGRAWTNRDRALASGLMYYEQSLNAHGIPSWLAQDPDRRFEVDEVMDHAAAVLEEVQEEYQRGKNDQKGLRLVVVDQGPRD